MTDTNITIVGNLTANPELRFTQAGAAVASFTVASTPRVFDKASKEYRDGETLFVRVSVWKELAENVAESLTKGQRVIVAGKLKSRSYEKDGQKRTSIELEAEEVGPSLKFSVAKTERAAREKPKPEPDPWGAADTEAPPF
jgi:single-strand DNA-binding protein